MTPTSNHSAFQLDDRSSLDLQNFILQFAEHIGIENGVEVENWQQYLNQNLGFRLVSLLAFNPQEIDDGDDLLADHIKFIGKTRDYLQKKAENQPEEAMAKRLKKDFEDLIKESELDLNDVNQNSKEQLIRFYQQTKANLRPFYDDLFRQSGQAPDTGLLFAFVQLFYQHLIPDLNKLPSKLNQFYYESVLNKKSLPPLPDIVHVYFEPAQSVKKTYLEKGIALFAGRDLSNKNIIFKTQTGLELSQARLEDIRTLYFSPKDAAGAGGIFKNYCFSADEDEYFETFGRNVALYKKPEVHEIADFGFAVASKLLYLREGERTIHLAWKDVEKKLLLKLKEKCVFEITTKESWVEVEAVEVEEGAFKLTLSKEFPPIEPLAQFAGHPAVRCIFKKQSHNSKHTLSLYHELKNLSIEPQNIELAVDVKGMQNLVCYNDLGILNISQPFQPFGATPAKYSKFIVGNAEVFQKPLKKIRLRLNWNLPTWDFGQYFAAYDDDQIKDSSKYKVVTNLKDSSKSTQGEEQGLFDNKTDDEDLAYTIDIKTSWEEFAQKDWSTELPPYSKDTKWGYLELQLSAPKHPFGSGLFQQVIARRIGQNQAEGPIINPPIIPELTGIELDYTAKDSDSTLFFHIHPFGKELMSNSGPCSLITQKYETESQPYQGLLFLGIKDLSPGLLSIYFELAGSSLIPSSSESDVNSPETFLVSDNNLLSVTKVADSTEGFEQSGVIQLNIESKVLDAAASTILPSGLSWIVFAVEKNAETFGLTNCIHLHGAAAVRSSGIVQENGNRQIVISGNTITRTLDDVPAIRKVFQPFPSFNGRTREEKRSFSWRIANEIRHANRPAKAVDVEEIIYNKFPEVDQCKAYSEGKQLHLVVVPFKSTTELLPAFPISFLRKVKAFVAGLVSPFIKITVENPHYAVLQAHLYFELKPGTDIPNLGQLKYQLRHDLIHKYLNPWNGNRLSIGEAPDFLTLKEHIGHVYEGLKLEEYRFYYFYFTKSGGYFDYFEHNTTNKIESKNIIFIPDPNAEYHQLFFDETAWSSHLDHQKVTTGEVIHGSLIRFDREG